MVFKLWKRLGLDPFYKMGVLLRFRLMFLLLKGSWKSTGLDVLNTFFSTEILQFSILLLLKALEEVSLLPRKDQERHPVQSLERISGFWELNLVTMLSSPLIPTE